MRISAQKSTSDEFMSKHRLRQNESARIITHVRAAALRSA
jgi:hypothetical protein